MNLLTKIGITKTVKNLKAYEQANRQTTTFMNVVGKKQGLFYFGDNHLLGDGWLMVKKEYEYKIAIHKCTNLNLAQKLIEAELAIPYNIYGGYITLLMKRIY